MRVEVEKISYDNEFLNNLVEGKEPEMTIFYEQYDRMIWDIARKWNSSIYVLSKGEYEIEDSHNELWAHIFKNLDKCDLSKASLGSWVYMVAENKIGMVKRSFETQKNDRAHKETNFSLNSTPVVLDDNKHINILNMIGDDPKIDEAVSFQEGLLDYIYALLELIDACTEKERKVYLLKIQGKNPQQIAEEAKVSKSYIPKVYKRLAKKFKILYDSLDEQTYIDKKERNELANDLLNKKSTKYICNKYDLEAEIIDIFKEMLSIVGL